MSRGSNCSFVNNNLTSNEASFGGGIAVESHDDSGFAENITFYNNTLLYNHAYNGGGVVVQADQVNFTDNVISNNTADVTGGAFWIVGDDVYIENLTSDYNTALNGGSCAIHCDDVIVKNSTFTGNQENLEGLVELYIYMEQLVQISKLISTTTLLKTVLPSTQKIQLEYISMTQISWKTKLTPIY